jgi:hypothetical protein
VELPEDKLYRRSGNLLSYGLKMFSDKVFVAEYAVEYPFMRY